MTHLPDHIVRFLDGKTFTVSDACAAARIPPASLTNLLHKASLEMVSPAPGRGRPRSFCLGDVYILGVMTHLVRWMSDYRRSAAAVGNLAFGALRVLLEDGGLPYSSDDEMRKGLQRSVFNGPPWFYRRDFSSPYYMLLFGDQPPVFVDGTAEASEMIRFAWDGLLAINLTSAFAEVDQVLAELCGFDFEGHAQVQAWRLGEQAIVNALSSGTSAG